MQPSNALEKTYKVSQAEIREAAGLAAAAKGFDLNLDGANGGVVGRWTRDGKHLGLATKRGHISTLNFQSSTLGSEIFLNESCRDFTCVLAFPSCFWRTPLLIIVPSPHRNASYLHSSSFYAVAQKKHVFIYDQDGTELQCVSTTTKNASRLCADALSLLRTRQ